MLIYMDNCCYNRPYDDQAQLRISLETQAKVFIQAAVKNNRVIDDLKYIHWLLQENE